MADGWDYKENNKYLDPFNEWLEEKQDEVLEKFHQLHPAEKISTGVGAAVSSIPAGALASALPVITAPTAWGGGLTGITCFGVANNEDALDTAWFTSEMETYALYMAGTGASVGMGYVSSTAMSMGTQECSSKERTSNSQQNFRQTDAQKKQTIEKLNRLLPNDDKLKKNNTFDRSR